MKPKLSFPIFLIVLLICSVGTYGLAWYFKADSIWCLVFAVGAAIGLIWGNYFSPGGRQ